MTKDESWRKARRPNRDAPLAKEDAGNKPLPRRRNDLSQASSWRATKSNAWAKSLFTISAVLSSQWMLLIIGNWKQLLFALQATQENIPSTFIYCVQGRDCSSNNTEQISKKVRHQTDRQRGYRQKPLPRRNHHLCQTRSWTARLLKDATKHLPVLTANCKTRFLWHVLYILVTETKFTRRDPKVIGKNVLYGVVMLSEFTELKKSKVKRMTMWLLLHSNELISCS